MSLEELTAYCGVLRAAEMWRVLARGECPDERIDVSSTVRAPRKEAIPNASRVRASQIPLPRDSGATATSSIQARMPLGIRRRSTSASPTILIAVRE